MDKQSFNSPFISFFLCVIITFILDCKNQNDDITLRFSNGVNPIEYSLRKDSIWDTKSNTFAETNKSCESCHKQIYLNWSKSRHKEAYTNSLFQTSYQIEPMEWCLNCHAPLLGETKDSNQNQLKRIQIEDGVSCITCHVREGKILTGKIPKSSSLAHNYKKVETMNESKFCANCHQFSFPTSQSLKKNHSFQYSEVAMQDTYNEWLKTKSSKQKTCQSCHLASGKKDSHTFPGGHSLQLISDSFDVSASKISNNQILIKIQSIGIGHSFPTGDLFRALRFRVYDPKHNFLKEWIFKKEYTTNKNPKPNEPTKTLIANTVFESEELKTLILQTEFNLNSIDYDFYIDYQNGLNELIHLETVKESRKVFQSGSIPLTQNPSGHG